MASATDTDRFTPVGQVPGVLASFNRYGLPGLVIGAQFLIISALLYVGITALQSNTKAMTAAEGAMSAHTKAVDALTQAIREMRR